MLRTIRNILIILSILVALDMSKNATIMELKIALIKKIVARPPSLVPFTRALTRE